MEVSAAIESLVWVALISATAPLISALLPVRVPQVVVLLVGGVLVGPEVLDFADPDNLELLAEVGLGFLFLLAGYEVEPELVRDRVFRTALLAWFAALVLAIAVVGGLASSGFVPAFVPVAIGLTTTAFGTLLPILREHGWTEGPFGRSVMASGVVGEVLPVAAIAIFLGSRSEFVGLISLVLVAALAVGLTVLPKLLSGTRIEAAYLAHSDSTSQSSVRATVLLLVLFLAIASRVGLDVVLGAFLAGMALRQMSRLGAEGLELKLDAVGYGFFIPVFFVCSGMNLDVQSIVDQPARLVVFFLLLLGVRGFTTFLVFRRSLDRIERLQLALLSATALPLLVALTHIGLANGTMLPANAAALVGAGALSVLVFPSLAVALEGRRRARVVDHANTSDAS